MTNRISFFRKSKKKKTIHGILTFGDKEIASSIFSKKFHEFGLSAFFTKSQSYRSFFGFEKNNICLYDMLRFLIWNTSSDPKKVAHQFLTVLRVSKSGKPHVFAPILLKILLFLRSCISQNLKKYNFNSFCPLFPFFA